LTQANYKIIRRDQQGSIGFFLKGFIK